jgi:hypothetical protein
MRDLTEQDWLTASYIDGRLVTFIDSLSPRKQRLFAAACCRRIWDLIPDPSHREAVLLAERVADKLVKSNRLGRVAETLDADSKRSRDPWGRHAIQAVRCAVNPLISGTKAASTYATDAMVIAQLGLAERSAGSREYFAALEQEGRHGIALLRDIAGNPFRPVALDPNWLTSTVVALAKGIYEERAFDRMPILADALQDAGCDSDEVLTHCRGSGPHVRGCWVVDLILGKS